MMSALESLFSWAISLTLKISGITYIQYLWNFFQPFSPSIINLVTITVCFVSFEEGNIWNSCMYIGFFVESIILIWSRMSFSLLYIAYFATYFHLNILTWEFVKWILGLLSNNISLNN